MVRWALVVALLGRDRVTAPAFLDGAGGLEWMRPAQTIHQLVAQMARAGRYSPADVEQVMRAHHLSLSLTGDVLRGQGRPLDVHLVSTASLTIHFNQPLQATLTMLCHSLVLFAQMSCGARGERAGLDARPMRVGRARVAAAIASSGIAFSPEAIDIVLNWDTNPQYSGARVTPEMVARPRGLATRGLAEPAAEPAVLAADVAILWAINELDELLASYLVGFELMPPTPPESVLLALDSRALADATAHARAWLREQYAASPDVWRAAAHLDPQPSPYSFRLPLPESSPGTCAYRLALPLALNPLPQRKGVVRCSREQEQRVRDGLRLLGRGSRAADAVHVECAVRDGLAGRLRKDGGLRWRRRRFNATTD